MKDKFEISIGVLCFNSRRNDLQREMLGALLSNADELIMGQQSHLDRAWWESVVK